MLLFNRQRNWGPNGPNEDHLGSMDRDRGLTFQNHCHHQPWASSPTSPYPPWEVRRAHDVGQG